MRRPHIETIARLIVWLAYLAFVSAGVDYSPYLAAGLAVLPLAIVVAGFFYSLPRFCGVLLPPAEAQSEVSVDGVVARSFPQGITYRISMARLWLLAAVPMISFAVWAAVSLKWIVAHQENPLPFYSAMAALALSFCIAFRWLHERALLRMNGVTLAFVQGISRSEARYEFFDQHGERFGGTKRFFGRLAAGVPAPIFVNLRNPDRSLLFASFWFFRFQVVDARHVSRESLVRREGA